MIDCAEAIALSSLERKESRGAQFRLDYPSRDDENWLKHIVVTRGELGAELSHFHRSLWGTPAKQHFHSLTLGHIFLFLL
jgi:succinate dehydrogenase/fumarate reductase flavoprotein subunit